MKPIKIALIGVNENSHYFQVLSRICQLTELFEVVGIAFPENEKERLPENCAKFAHLPELTVEQILSDPTIEAVAVETDEIYCTKYALMAVKAGKHVHMEKPGGRELADFRELIATAKEKNLIFCPGYMYRWNPYIQELLAAIKAGELGDIISVEAQMSRYDTVEDRQWMGAFPGGMLFFLGCHLIDLIYLIQGQPKKVIPLSCCTNQDGVTSQDFGMVAYEYENGVSFARTVTIERGGHRRRQLVVVGTKATWELMPLETGPESAMTTGRTIYTKGRPWSDPGEKSTCQPFDRYIDMLTHFAQCVRGEKENPFSLDHELAVYELLLKSCGVE